MIEMWDCWKHNEPMRDEWMPKPTNDELYWRAILAGIQNVPHCPTCCQRIVNQQQQSMMGPMYPLEYAWRGQWPYFDRGPYSHGSRELLGGLGRAIFGG
jgi:hypothetical protein